LSYVIGARERRQQSCSFKYDGYIMAKKQGRLKH
jgi:hypothetical protein